jgi:hypothetical protein
MGRAALLHADTYEEVEADRSSIRQAFAIVAGACAAAAIARYVLSVQAGVAGDRLAFQVVLSLLEPLVVWVGGSAFALMVGATFLRGPHTASDFAEVLRTTGFAFAPALLRVLACVPPWTFGLALDLVARAWTFAAVVVAIRQALDFSTPRAIATFGAAALLLWLVLWGASVAPLPC